MKERYGKVSEKVVRYIKMHLERKNMKKADGKEIIDFLSDKWHAAVCPMCGGREWNATDKIFELREFNEGNAVIGGAKSAVFPIIPVTCKNCGNTVFINALTTGLLKE